MRKYFGIAIGSRISIKTIDISKIVYYVFSMKFKLFLFFIIIRLHLSTIQMNCLSIKGVYYLHQASIVKNTVMTF